MIRRFFTIYTLLLFSTIPLFSQVSELKGLTESDTILKFNSNKNLGFNFEYIIYIPKGYNLNEEKYLLVETINTGTNDSIEYHLRGAIRAVSKSSVSNYISKKLKLPLLMPIFPRTFVDDEYYTHALDRDTFFCEGKEIERLDLQLLNMIEDAKRELLSRGFKIKEKFFVSGFSASGTFANRFSILHPEKIKAIAVGGINAIPILPINEYRGKVLNYPLGVADTPIVTKSPINLKAFKSLPQFLYMGELDSNDAVKFNDAFSYESRQIIFNLIGEKLIPNRWKCVENIYRENGVNAKFFTYKGVGHNLTLDIFNDLVLFFKSQ